MALRSEWLMIYIPMDSVNDGFDNFLEDFGSHWDSCYAVSSHRSFFGRGDEPCPMACVERLVPLFLVPSLNLGESPSVWLRSARRSGPGTSQSVSVSRPGGSPAKVRQIMFLTGYLKFWFGYTGYTGYLGLSRLCHHFFVYCVYIFFFARICISLYL
jgi:hypothetical protein